jgi:hypothetical protein
MAKYNYLVTGVTTYPVTNLYDWSGEAYTDEQALYFFKKKNGYKKKYRDLKVRRGSMVVDPDQTCLNVG